MFGVRTGREEVSDDQVQAYEWVNNNHTIVWSELRLTAVGMEGIYPGGRYPLILRFARHDFGLTDWECPAMDRVLLGYAERRPMAEEDQSKHPVVSVSREGLVTIDDRAVDPKELRPVLAGVKERDSIADLYRQDWRSKPHPTASGVLD